MSGLLTLIERLGEIALILFGFGLVVFIHELGHFLAARWAGVRVLAFAIGFGPALVSWRRGLGLRRGSSAAEYQQIEYTAFGEAGEARETARAMLSGRVSPTEYRLNWLPLGGYVKMLGQDDADPSHRSEARDSFNMVPIWKRMVIISAGVVANMVSAAALFVVVFSIGLETPAPIVGRVADGSPAARATPDAEGVAPGLMAGDRLVLVRGKRPRSFDDARVAVMTSGRGEVLPIVVDRPGVGEVAFSVVPEGTDAGILEAGFGPGATTRLIDPGGGPLADQLRSLLDAAGLGGVGLGWSMVSVDGAPVAMWHEVEDAASAARGEPVLVAFEGPAGERAEVEVATTPAFASEREQVGADTVLYQSLVGFVPVMTVGSADEGSRGHEQGLRTGDVFARLGGYEYPNEAEGIAAVRAAAGGEIPATVWRDGALVDLTLSVRGNGTVGFLVGGTHTSDDARVATLVASGPGDPYVRPGSRVLTVNGEPVGSLREMAQRLQGLAGDGSAGFAFDLEVESPVHSERVESVVDVSDEQAAWLAGMGWDLPAALSAVEPAMTVLRSEGPVDAVALGLGETHRIMTMTYTTFVRLFQGTIRPKVLNGPVGIVHAGTTLIDNGLVWLLFFFALVSVNLAVINFLPIPITDGGHMVFLAWEQITGRPVSVVVQNVATLAGLVLIAVTFVFVTYNDLARLLGS